MPYVSEFIKGDLVTYEDLETWGHCGTRGVVIEVGLSPVKTPTGAHWFPEVTVLWLDGDDAGQRIENAPDELVHLTTT